MMGTKYDCTVQKHSKDRNYKGHCIFTASPNSSGIKYFAHSKSGTLRADTLSGIKTLITEYI